MEPKNLVAEIEAYLTKYVTFAEPFYALPCALWAMATHCWPEFDAFPYLGISAATKKSGKTTLKDCMVPLAANGEKFSVNSPASMFRVMEEGKGTFPTMFIDECEALISETHPAREFLNKGVERGEYITKSNAQGDSLKFSCYCPKVFVGIGGVYDTLRDRAIVVMMKRRSPIESAKAVRIRQSVRDAEANELREKISFAVNDRLVDISSDYDKAEILDFIDERAEKCWTPLFIIAKIFCPERVQELIRIAVDMEADKDAPILRATGKEWEAKEKEADDAEARILLLRDMLKITTEIQFIKSTELVDLLKEIPTSQWRRFRGRGITVDDIGSLMDAFNVHPKVTRTKSGRAARQAQARGYRREDLEAAAILAGLMEK